MEPTVLMHAGAAVQLLPPAAVLFLRGALGPARRWVVIWCLLLAVLDGASLALGMAGISNLWLGYVGAPVSGAVALWMLSHWHPDGTARLTLRVAIPIFVALSVSLSVWVDNPTTFSVFAAPFHHLVLLLAALWTFVTCALRTERTLATSDWFWVLTGIMLYAGASTTVQAVVGYLVGADRLDLMMEVINLKAGASVVAFIAVAGGMLCPTRPMRSGGRSLRPSSPSPSS